ncbi:NAD(P)/FAD-dependent oxidoreductase [Hutsoniella sourekii]
MKKYDVIVVGAGTSGLMAAVNASQQGARVLILEKNKVPGRKLLLSGGGRCNVTNRTSRDQLIAHIPGNGKFLYSALNQFDQEDIIHFFQENGVELKEEDHGRMFPTTDKARTILDTLLQLLEDGEVTIQYSQPVQSLLFEEDQAQIKGVKCQDGQVYQAASVILAVGGKTYPRTGATGDGYAWAKTAGHTVTWLYPTEVPLLSHDPEITNNSLKGVSLRDVKVSFWDQADHKKRPITSHQMDMIVTHFGYSGPAILRCSGHVNQWLKDHPGETAHLSIDLTPDLSTDDLAHFCQEFRERQVITLLKEWMPERMGLALCNRLKLDPTVAYKQLDHQEAKDLVSLIKDYPMTAYGSQAIDKGFVTGGGVDVKEIDPKTMASKLIKGLYFCGELLDINGYTGGYNITAAFVTGTLAGRYAAWQSFS